MFPGGENTCADVLLRIWVFSAHLIMGGALVPLALINKSKPEPSHVTWP